MKIILKLIFITFILTFHSCVSPKELVNFSDDENFIDRFPQQITQFEALKIQVDDLISIKVTVSSLEKEAALPFNIDPPNINMANIGGGNNGVRPLIGYLVNENGNIEFPVIGTMKIQGLTLVELKEKLEKELVDGGYLLHPVVNVRFLNFRITVLGEVNRPGTFIFSSERVTLLDAIGQAGDLSPYGNRKNIIVIREQDGQRSIGELDLKSGTIFGSPFFYLKQNDVVYVEPLPEKTASLRDQSQRLLPWVSVITGLVTLVVTLSNL